MRDLCRRRVLGHGDENLRQIQLAAGTRRHAALLQQRVNFVAADANALVHFTLTHAFGQDLVAHVVAEGGVRQSLLLQAGAQLLQRQLVLQRHIGDRAVDLGLVQPRPGFARVGDLDALVNQRFQHLTAQLRSGWQGGLGALRVVLQARQPRLQFGVRHQLLIHDGEDVVGRARCHHAARRRRRRWRWRWRWR